MSLCSALWKVQDLVLVEQRFVGQEKPRLTAGIVVDVKKEKSNYWGESFFYYTLVEGEILKIGEVEYTKIVRRITDTSEDFWGNLKR